MSQIGKSFVIPKSIKKELDSHAKQNQIVVRFPPEPSGYLHLGHLYALNLNYGIYKSYQNAKFIVRFDDTNPKMESDEYEQAIFEDLNDLKIDMSNVTYASDYFDLLIEKANELIKID